MRDLSLNDIQQVSGAGFAEDMNTAASTILVAKAVSELTTVAAQVGIKGAMTIGASGSLVTALGFVSSTTAIAAPLLLANALYPEDCRAAANKVAAYFS